ncbi:uncharacterized protein LOC143851242 [Tasmannia lanceolata]|uniref:uncharacterized protein LOC143851242 n=1 Tax=Tasmannia lanceolata TaxID=3420 RepID=UPI00406481BA
MTSVCVFFFFFFFFFLFSSASSIIQPQNQILSRAEHVFEAGYGEEKLSSVLVTGTVLCDSCLHGETQTRTWQVRGALVAVTCKTGRKRGNVKGARASTDEYGDFIIDLPSHLHAIPKLDKLCMVRVLRLPKSSSCRQGFLKKTREIRLSSVGNGIRTYTTGVIRFEWPSKPSHVCLRKGGGGEEERSW